MSVLFDASTMSEGRGNRIFNHTVAAGDPALFVWVGTGKGTSLTVLSITQNGVALTQVHRVAFGNDAIVELWKRPAPDTGLQQIFVDVVGNPKVVVAVAMSFTGADQVDPVGAFNSATGENSPATVGVVSAADEFCADMYAEIEGPEANVGAGQTERQRNTDTGPEPQVASSTEPGAAGTVTMSWQTDTEWAIIALSVKAAAAGATYFPGFRVQGEGDLALTDVGTHSLRIRRSGVTRGLELVSTADPNASRIRVRTPSGTMAIRKFT